jgi:hypothetical protein
MARPATAHRPARGRPSCLDRPAQRPGAHAVESPPVERTGPLGHDTPVSTPSPSPVESPPSDLTPHVCWALLPVALQRQFELRLSRLVLKAARIPSLDAEEMA